MPRKHRGSSPGTEPTDAFLIESLLAGDEAALRALMARYDRLVRFTIYRSSKAECAADPQWLDSVASAAWAGAVHSLRRRADQRVDSLPALLVTIARNQVISALRARRSAFSPTAEDAATAEVEARSNDAAALMDELDLLNAVRECAGALDPEDQAILSQAELLLGRRFTQAADALGTSESTLRYRWARVLQRLRDCVEGKTGRAMDGPQSADEPPTSPPYT